MSEVFVFLAAMLAVAFAAVHLTHAFSLQSWQGFALVFLGYVWGTVVGCVMGRPRKEQP